MIVREEDKYTGSATEHHICLCFAVEFVLGILECFGDVLVAQFGIFREPRISSVGWLRRFTITAGVVAAPDTWQEPIAHYIVVCFWLLSVHYFVVLIYHV